MPEGPRQRLLLALAEPGECPSPTLFPFPSLTRALGGGGRRRLHAAPLLYISPGPGPCRPSAPHCLHELWAFWGSRAAPPLLPNRRSPSFVGPSCKQTPSKQRIDVLSVLRCSFRRCFPGAKWGHPLICGGTYATPFSTFLTSALRVHGWLLSLG